MLLSTCDQRRARILLDEEGTVCDATSNLDGGWHHLQLVTIVGEDIKFFCPQAVDLPCREFLVSQDQAFGAGTTNLLRTLSVAVVGCSGTGSPTIMQLARLGVRRLVLIDDDHVEARNLNRIYGSSSLDAEAERLKVDVLKEAVLDMGLGTEVTTVPRSICEPDAIATAAEADILFGCMDGAEGRHILNRLAAFYSLPYLDVGVRLEADGNGGVDLVCGTVHYLRPDGSSLMSRRAITREQVEAEALRRTDPDEYRQRLESSYIKGVAERSPAVISVNSFMASLTVCELLARLHPHRSRANSEYATTRVSLTDGFMMHEGEPEACQALSRYVGFGDVEPVLMMPALNVVEAPA